MAIFATQRSGAKAAQQSWSMPERAAFVALKEFELYALLGQKNAKARTALRGMRLLQNMGGAAGAGAVPLPGGLAAGELAAGDAPSLSKNQRKRLAKKESKARAKTQAKAEAAMPPAKEEPVAATEPQPTQAPSNMAEEAMDTGAEVGLPPAVTAADPEGAKDASAPPAVVPAGPDAGEPPLVVPADLAPGEAAPMRAIGACAAAAVALWEAAPPSVLSTPARAAAKAAPGEEGSPERELFGHKGVRRAPETPAKARQPAKQSKARAGLLARFDQLAA